MADPFSDDPEFVPLTRIQVLVAMGITAVVLLVVSKLWVKFGSGLMLPISWSSEHALIGVGLGVGITLASSVIYALWAEYRQRAASSLHLVLSPLVFPDIIWLGLLPGLSEELLFRGVMLPTFGLDAAGILFSSLCFGMLHLSSFKQWSYVVWATAIGGVLGVSALMTNNLLVPILAHITTNFISGCLWKWRGFKDDVA
ncbi:MAG: CPBP family intramembrane metalloprotease [Leptolyngbyaceae cyanobacterium CAN_BIN12]|nr:CPBP family intramembrane metalloprotease [Leptolyngbyaceae cyanobacterium CAN_BIN12]